MIAYIYVSYSQLTDSFFRRSIEQACGKEPSVHFEDNLCFYRVKVNNEQLIGLIEDNYILKTAAKVILYH